MKVNKMKVQVNTIPTVNPNNNKTLNRGRRCEIAVRAEHLGYVEYVCDNVCFTDGGDLDKGNYFYQVKANRSEISLPKAYREVATQENYLTTYFELAKANRYIYVVEVDGVSYEIIMSKLEFINFTKKFYRYNASRKEYRINILDTTILNWARLNV